MVEKGYDVIIIGSGPAGIFTALELLEKKENLNILMIDKGKDITNRSCPAIEEGKTCQLCKPCKLLTGWGGSGAFSDGKLTLTTEVGGWLNEYQSKERLNELVKYVDKIYLNFGATKKIYGTNADEVSKIDRKATFAGLKLIPYQVRHLGTENCREILRKMKEKLQKHVDIRLNENVKHIIVEREKAKGVELENGEKIKGKYIVVAPGRVGADWITEEVKRIGLETKNNPIDVGVRVELLAEIMEEITSILHEPKFIYYTKSFDDLVRTFCVCPHGEVTIESTEENAITVNGQSYANRKSGNTNFAILVSTSFTEPFKEPIAYGKYLARLANILSGGSVIIQRLGDLKIGRRSTPERIARSIVKQTLKTAIPGDLSFVLPYRFLQDILEMLKALDKVTPGVYSDHTLLYGIETKFYSSRINVNNELETKKENLYTIGDGAGITRGLIQASISGVIAARSIITKEHKTINNQ